ncbi:hypothetical protein I79_016894 [Cricetulus griseus]|uniref:Uncharacterized protein n=1 Tax=Cricetulus griseus TaxID=10029 RepID=G3I0K6_CRIGR|nr:hypothetical protein I79_016894 [Cricetulus griseus]
MLLERAPVHWTSPFASVSMCQQLVLDIPFLTESFRSWSLKNQLYNGISHIFISNPSLLPEGWIHGLNFLISIFIAMCTVSQKTDSWSSPDWQNVNFILLHWKISSALLILLFHILYFRNVAFLRLRKFP